jgi:hypothetical protein
MTSGVFVGADTAAVDEAGAGMEHLVVHRLDCIGPSAGAGPRRPRRSVAPACREPEHQVVEVWVALGDLAPGHGQAEEVGDGVVPRGDCFPGSAEVPESLIGNGLEQLW